MDARTTRCIECGGFVDSLNEDEQGIPCPACAERLLETLPGVFHRPWMEPWAPAQDGAPADALADEADEAPAVPLDELRSADEDPGPGPDLPA